jgi:hypothetical protein
VTITLPERLAVIAEDLLKGRFIDSGRWDLHNGHDYHDRTSESTPTSSSQRHRRTSSSPHDGEMESRKKGNSYTMNISPFGRAFKRQLLYQGPDRCALDSYLPRLIFSTSS